MSELILSFTQLNRNNKKKIPHPPTHPPKREIQLLQLPMVWSHILSYLSQCQEREKAQLFRIRLLTLFTSL